MPLQAPNTLVSKTQFSYNVVTLGCGGSLALHATNAKITNSSFVGDAASLCGGAVVLSYTSNATVRCLSSLPLTRRPSLKCMASSYLPVVPYALCLPFPQSLGRSSCLLGCRIALHRVALSTTTADHDGF